jgi:Pyridoxamine 5'-phosphate oxidase
MTGQGLPEVAREAFEEAPFCHVAVRTRFGPHLTPVVFACVDGELWVTTSRSSVKAAAWKRHPFVGGLVRHGEVAVSFRGRVRSYDALDLRSWPSSVLDAPTLARAALRFTAKNLRFFGGYAVDARKVPLSWTPPARVFARIEVTAGRILEEGGVAGGWGSWRTSLSSMTGFEDGVPGPSLDRGVPRSVASAVGLSRRGGTGAVAFDQTALTVLPARWRRVATHGRYEVVLPRTHASLVDIGRPELPMALTIDHASEWRASRMQGLLVRGTATVFDPAVVGDGAAAVHDRIRAVAGGARPEDHVLVRLRPSRLVWWEGWSSGVVR